MALGNPHFSLEEHRRLAELCQGREKHPLVAVVLTAGPQAKKHQRDSVKAGATLLQVLAQARERGYSATLEEFGVQLVSDTCWCMLGEAGDADKLKHSRAQDMSEYELESPTGGASTGLCAPSLKPSADDKFGQVCALRSRLLGLSNVC